MLVDLAALALLLVFYRFIGPIPRLQWKASNLTSHEWFVLVCLIAASLLGWLSILINNDFHSFTSPGPGTAEVRGQL